MKARQSGGLESLACYQHPPELEPSSKLPTSIEKHLDEGNDFFFNLPGIAVTPLVDFSIIY